MGLAAPTNQRHLFVPTNSDKDLHGVGCEEQGAGDSAFNQKATLQRDDRYSVAFVFSVARILRVASDSN